MLLVYWKGNKKAWIAHDAHTDGAPFGFTYRRKEIII